jgi:hypothetical protein
MQSSKKGAAARRIFRAARVVSFYCSYHTDVAGEGQEALPSTHPLHEIRAARDGGNRADLAAPNERGQIAVAGSPGASLGLFKIWNFGVANAKILPFEQALRNPETA